MLTLATDRAAGRDRTERPAYRPFRATVQAVRQLSPHFIRVTFCGDDFDVFGTAALDQRIKLVLPLEGDDAPRGFAHLGLLDADVIEGGGWYERWKAAPDARRNPFRTYTVRAIRPAQRELDVDFAVHGDGGPASRWVHGAQPGDEVVVVGPDDRSTGWRIGLDWRPGAACELLLVGDETALPAIAGILDSVCREPSRRATVFLEIPSAEDALPLAPGADVHWMPRDGRARGVALADAVRSWVHEHRATIAPEATPASAAALDESDVAAGLVWDSPAGPADGDFYAWIAGETQTVVRLRRFLVREIGLDRSRVAFMGYWRRGAAETTD